LEENKKYTSHPSAVIDEGCKIGAGSKIWHFSHIMSQAVIGRKVQYWSKRSDIAGSCSG
jgi:UDP-3-O-[3-hydroxymyristoyl] glucosamine N-acyltransferase